MNRMVTAETELTREEVEVVLQLVTQGIWDRINENFGFDDVEWAEVALLARNKIADMLKLMDAQVDEDDEHAGSVQAEAQGGTGKTDGGGNPQCG